MAKRAFAEKGAAVGLEHIARQADVSIATLYRHFPTRDELISAVYQQEVTALIQEADQLMTEREPVAALREWLMSFVEFLDAKHDMAAAMDTWVWWDRYDQHAVGWDGDSLACGELELLGRLLARQPADQRRQQVALHHQLLLQWGQRCLRLRQCRFHGRNVRSSAIRRPARMPRRWPAAPVIQY